MSVFHEWEPVEGFCPECGHQTDMRYEPDRDIVTCRTCGTRYDVDEVWPELEIETDWLFSSEDERDHEPKT